MQEQANESGFLILIVVIVPGKKLDTVFSRLTVLEYSFGLHLP